MLRTNNPPSRVQVVAALGVVGVLGWLFMRRASAAESFVNLAPSAPPGYVPGPTAPAPRAPAGSNLTKGAGSF